MLNDQTKERLAQFLAENDFPTKPKIYRETPPPKAVNTAHRPKKMRFKCPECDIAISTSYSMPFECPKCGVKMIEVVRKKNDSPAKGVAL